MHRELNFHAGSLKSANDRHDLPLADAKRFSDFGRCGRADDVDLAVLFRPSTAALNSVSAPDRRSAFRYLLHLAVATPLRWVCTEAH